MENWESYYQRKLNERHWSYFYYHFRRLTENAPYIEEVISSYNRFDSRPALVIGVGAGTDTIALTSFGFKVIGIDNELLFESVQKHSEEINPNLHLRFVCADMLNIPLPDDSVQLVTGMGVLEHYSNKMIIDALKEALRVSAKYVFVVPTDLYQEGNKQILSLTAKMGDERLVTVQEWEQLIHLAGGRIRHKFGYWDPNLKSTFVHPLSLAECYGKGLLAVYAIERDT